MSSSSYSSLKFRDPFRSYSSGGGGGVDDSDPLRDPITKELKPFVDPAKYEASKKQDTIASAKRDIYRYEKEIQEYREKIAAKKGIISEVSSEMQPKFTIMDILSFSPIILPLFISVILYGIVAYNLSDQRQNLGILYNTVYQPIVIHLTGSIIMILILMFLLSQKVSKQMMIGSIIVSSGISIVLTSMSIDKLGKTYLFSDGSKMSANAYVSSGMLYWNIVLQFLTIVGVIFLHEKIDFLFK